MASIKLKRCLPRLPASAPAARAGLCLLLALSSLAAAAQGVAYSVDPAHSHVHWEVLHFGTSTSRGRFSDIAGGLQLDPSGTGEVSISINTGSVNTGVAPLNGVLRTGYLSTDVFPQAYFVASGWRWKMDAPLEVRGELTLHGVSRPVTLRAPLLHCYTHPMLKREVCGADLEGDLKRSDFSITDGLPFIADKVHLVIQVEAIRN